MGRQPRFNVNRDRNPVFPSGIEGNAFDGRQDIDGDGWHTHPVERALLGEVGGREVLNAGAPNSTSAL